MKSIEVYHHGKVKLLINPTLLDRQKAWKNLEKIKEAHQLKLIVYEMMEETNDVAELRSLADDVTEIEFELQALWGFWQDIKWHRFWTVPKCSCPRTDNEERYPTGKYIHSFSCLVHGLSVMSHSDNYCGAV